MTNNNSATNSIFGATEHQVINLSMAEIISGLFEDYKSFSHGNNAGIRIPENNKEPRLVHSRILYAEGLRLAETHLQLAKKLIFTSLFDGNLDAVRWLILNGEMKQLRSLQKLITAFEAYKEVERQKEEEEKERQRLAGMKIA